MCRCDCCCCYCFCIGNWLLLLLLFGYCHLYYYYYCYYFVLVYYYYYYSYFYVDSKMHAQRWQHDAVAGAHAAEADVPDAVGYFDSHNVAPTPIRWGMLLPLRRGFCVCFFFSVCFCFHSNYYENLHRDRTLLLSDSTRCSHMLLTPLDGIGHKCFHAMMMMLLLKMLLASSALSFVYLIPQQF